MKVIIRYEGDSAIHEFGSAENNKQWSRKMAKDEDTTKEGNNIEQKFSKDRLINFVEKIEAIEEKKRALGGDIGSLYKQAEKAGLNAAVIRDVVKDRRKDKDLVAERETLKRQYKEAMGDFSSTPLGGTLKDGAEAA